MIIFSTANAFKRQEGAGLMRLLEETKSTVTARLDACCIGGRKNNNE